VSTLGGLDASKDAVIAAAREKVCPSTFPTCQQNPRVLFRSRTCCPFIGRIILTLPFSLAICFEKISRRCTHLAPSSLAGLLTLHRRRWQAYSPCTVVVGRPTHLAPSSLAGLLTLHRRRWQAASAKEASAAPQVPEPANAEPFTAEPFFEPAESSPVLPAPPAPAIPAVPVVEEPLVEEPLVEKPFSISSVQGTVVDAIVEEAPRTGGRPRSMGRGGTSVVVEVC
jgi:hypothetical protein